MILMSLDIFLPIVPAVLGGIVAAIRGAYTATDEFNIRKFFSSIPKAIGAGLIVLGGLAALGEPVSVGTFVGFWSVFAAGYIGVSTIKNPFKRGNGTT